MTTPRRKAIVAAGTILAVAFLLGGCGSDKPDDLSSGTTAATARGAGTATTSSRASDAVTGKNHREAYLKGASEVPRAGDADGSGTAYISEQVTGTAETFCYQIEAKQIAAPTAAHIHKAAETAAGPVVVTFGPFEADPKLGFVASGCVGVEAALAADIFRNPESYYVNVHNAEFPDGALRGQLAIGARCTHDTKPTTSNFGMAGLGVALPSPLLNRLLPQRCNPGGGHG